MNYQLPRACRRGRAVQPTAAGPKQLRNSAPAAAPPAAAPPDACHLIIRVDGEGGRQRVRDVLERLGLRPQEVWSTANAVSYRLGTDDASGTQRLLDGTDLGWTLVPPGAPDYLIHSLDVSGPDGRRFRIADAPAQLSVSNIAAEVVRQYQSGFTDAGRPTVVDHIGGGERRRLGSDETLHEAGIQDGDNLQIGFEATAGVGPWNGQLQPFHLREMEPELPPLLSLRDYGLEAVIGAHPVSVLVSQQVFDAFTGTMPFDDVEDGGFLTGTVHRDAEEPERFIVDVSAILPAEGTGASLLHFTFTGESFLRASELLARRGDGEQLVGWYHTHLIPTTDDFGLSSIDVALHTSTFRLPWQVAALVNVAHGQHALRCYAQDGKQLRQAGYVVRP